VENRYKCHNLAEGVGEGGEVRPRRWIRAVALLLLALGLANLGKAGVAVRYAARLPDLPMTTPWWYLVATGAFWGAVLVGCAVGLMLLRPWGRWAALAAATLYEGHAWANHLLFDASDYARQTRARDLVLTALFLAFVWGTLNWPGSKNLPQRTQRARRKQK